MRAQRRRSASAPIWQGTRQRRVASSPLAVHTVVVGRVRAQVRPANLTDFAARASTLLHLDNLLLSVHSSLVNYIERVVGQSRSAAGLL